MPNRLFPDDPALASVCHHRIRQLASFGSTLKVINYLSSDVDLPLLLSLLPTD
ncbi:hypothetical protein [Azospirillum picis]|uniref:Uncharacterized protein n=1 Tax=Azospirillum picis TaxID=488438 RepID=A0ABU0MV64_9PROT|nr:hypothetical protein [Azospirillum picis]MBP2303488.1 hypothetical protein [Azospirillum picis]MDQ0537367.1 hypothetical protein [Azospirillum picis]